jgi:uncharacterized protein (TIGR03067 family)
MKTFRQILTLGLAALAISTIAARAADSEFAKKDIAGLQGDWTMVSGSIEGEPMPPDMAKGMKRSCKGDEVTITMAGNMFFKAKFTLDPSKKPKTIDYEMTEGATKGKKQLGIYELDGDTFKACFGKPGAERPTEFTSKAGDGHTLSEWKRVSPDSHPAEKK